MPSLVQAMTTGAQLIYVLTENERYTEGIVARGGGRGEGGGGALRLDLHRRLPPRRQRGPEDGGRRSPRSISRWPSPARRSS